VTEIGFHHHANNLRCTWPESVSEDKEGNLSAVFCDYECIAFYRDNKVGRAFAYCSKHDFIVFGPINSVHHLHAELPQYTAISKEEYEVSRVLDT
jgi:hypothetical protein